MSVRQRLLDRDVDEIASRLVGAARQGGPSLAAQRRVATAVGAGAGAALISATAAAHPAAISASGGASVGIEASAATAQITAAGGIGKGLLGTSMAVIGKSLGVGLVVGLGTVGTAHWATTRTHTDSQSSLSIAGVAKAASDKTPRPSGDTAMARAGVSTNEASGVAAMNGPSLEAARPSDVLDGRVLGVAAGVEESGSLNPSGRTAKHASDKPTADDSSARAESARAKAAGVESARAENEVEAKASDPARAPSRVTNATGSSLAAEVSLLDDARAALRAGDGQTALRKLDRYQVEFREGTLANEAGVVRVGALLAVGKRDEAEREANRFLTQNPRGPLAERVRALMSGH